MGEKQRFKRWYIVVCVLAVICIVLACIPTSFYVKKADFADNGAVTEESSTDSGEVLYAIPDDSEGTYRFNTAYGGSDYEAEQSALKEKYPDLDLDKVQDYLGQQDFRGIFEKLNYTDENATDVTDRVQASIGGSEFDTDILNNYTDIYINEGVIPVAVIADYYVVSWIPDTGFYFVEDRSDSVYSQQYYKNQMVHLGKDTGLSFEPEHISQVETDFGYVIYLGHFKLNESVFDLYGTDESEQEVLSGE